MGAREWLYSRMIHAYLTDTHKANNDRTMSEKKNLKPERPLWRFRPYRRKLQMAGVSIFHFDASLRCFDASLIKHIGCSAVLALSRQLRRDGENLPCRKAAHWFFLDTNAVQTKGPANKDKRDGPLRAELNRQLLSDDSANRRMRAHANLRLRDSYRVEDARAYKH